MKPSKAFLIIATVFLTFALLLGGVYVYVSRTLTPEKMRDLIVAVLDENFPQAEVNVGDVDFKFGTSIDFVIKQIDVNGVAPLFSLRDAHIRIPIWAILKGGGIVELSIASPKINWRQSSEGNNWKLAMAGATPSDASMNQSVSEVHAGLPAFIMASRLNIKMRDSVITYEFSDKEKGELLISKFLVKEFGFENPAAFEIDTRLQMEEERFGTISSHILLIGEADLHRYVSDKRFSVVTVATISKTLAPQLAPITVPELRSELKLEIATDGLIGGTSKLNLKNSNITFSFKRENGGLSLADIQSNIITQDIIEIAGGGLSRFSAGKSQLNVSGSISRNEGSFAPDLKVELTPGASYAITPSIQSSLSASATLKDDKAELSALLGFLQGQLEIKATANFRSYLEPLVSKSTKLNLLVQGRNFNIASTDLESFKRDKDQPKSSLVSLFKKVRLFDSKLNLELESSFIVSHASTLNAQLVIDHKNNLNSKFEMNIGEGSIKVESKANLLKGISGTAKLVGTKVPGEVFNFLLEEDEGVLAGEIDLNVDTTLRGMAEDHQYRFEVAASKVRVEKINPVQWFNTVSSETLPLTKNGPTVDKSENFSSITSKGVMRNKVIKLSELKIEDIAKKYVIDGKGNISFLVDGRSELFLNYSSEMDIGVDVLPLMLVGNGFNLRPEIEYTIRNLTNKKSRNK